MRPVAIALEARHRRPFEQACTGAHRRVREGFGRQDRVGVAVLRRVGARHDGRGDAGHDRGEVTRLDEADIQPRRLLPRDGLGEGGQDRLVFDHGQVAAAPVLDIRAQAVRQARPARDCLEGDGQLAQVPPLLPHAARRRARGGGGHLALLDNRRRDAANRQFVGDRAPHHPAADDDDIRRWLPVRARHRAPRRAIVRSADAHVRTRATHWQHIRSAASVRKGSGERAPLSASLD